MSPVTLQINLAPTDYPHARLILPHQLRQLGPSVQEVLLVVDLHRSQGARFAEAWAERKPKMERLLSELSAADSRIRVVEVDYSPSTTRALSEQFFGGGRLPMKDSRGGPYHSYFFGLASAAHRHVLHLDADMLIGGGSRTWMAEAEALLAAREDLVSCSPLAGPPRADGTVAGSPASSSAMRATLRLSSPAWLAQPRITSATAAGSRSGLRRSSSRMVSAARSSGRTAARVPPKLPMGVRIPSMM